MKPKKQKVFDIIVIGSGLSGLNFIDKYLEKKKYINVIAPNLNKPHKGKKVHFLNNLPSQMKGSQTFVNNYFLSNNFFMKKGVKALGISKFGGLSDFWGLQFDSYFNNDQKNLKKKIFKDIENEFVKFCKKFNLIGKFYHKNKIVYNKDFIIPTHLQKLEDMKNSKYLVKKPMLAFSVKKFFNKNLNSINENKSKITATNFLKKLNNRKIKHHNYYVEKITKKANLIELICKNSQQQKKFIAKKIVLATGTLVTTKLIMDYLNIKREVKILHHPRLTSMFISSHKILSNLSFTPSLLQIINKKKNDYFSADLRPGNKMITDSIIEAFPLMKPLKKIINTLKNRLIFSNILLDSSNSDLYMKKSNNFFKIYSKDKNLKKVLKNKNFKIFKYLTAKKIIFPLFKTFYPGTGADFHYFGTIPFKKKGKMSVNENCQLRDQKNIYIADSSVFNFKTNKYPLGLAVANARRIGKILSK
jgi:hypothetical protein